MFAKTSSVRWLLVATGLILLAPRTETNAAPRNVFEGTVTAVGRDTFGVVDPLDLTLTQRQFAINQSTKFVRNGNLARFRELQPGDLVTVSFRPLGDKLLVLSMTAMSPP
jgi:hypothetical protein